MKTLKLTKIAAILVLSFALAGCGRDDDTDELESKIEQLEQEVTNLEKQNNSDPVNGSPQSDTADDTASNDTASNDTASGDTDSSDADTLKTLESAVTQIAQKIEKADATGSNKEKRTTFFDLKEELEKVEHRLDIYEDDIELKFRQGDLSSDEYRTEDRSVETLEDQLDRAEDELEFIFGIDD